MAQQKRIEALRDETKALERQRTLLRDGSNNGNQETNDNEPKKDK